MLCVEKNFDKPELYQGGLVLDPRIKLGCIVTAMFCSVWFRACGPGFLIKAVS